jgi:hypothetical protein
MLKLTIGLSERDQSRNWPARRYMRDNVGHKVLRADQIARPCSTPMPALCQGCWTT